MSFGGFVCIYFRVFPFLKFRLFLCFTLGVYELHGVAWSKIKGAWHYLAVEITPWTVCPMATDSAWKCGLYLCKNHHFYTQVVLGVLYYTPNRKEPPWSSLQTFFWWFLCALLWRWGWSQAGGAVLQPGLRPFDAKRSYPVGTLRGKNATAKMLTVLWKYK